MPTPAGFVVHPAASSEVNAAWWTGIGNQVMLSPQTLIRRKCWFSYRR